MANKRNQYEELKRDKKNKQEKTTKDASPVFDPPCLAPIVKKTLCINKLIH